MNNKSCIFLFFIILSITPTTVINQSPTQYPNQCYCSDICGPRNVRPDDSPFTDAETGICFCKLDDKENYLKNDCHLKNPNPSMPHSCCTQ